MATILVIEDEPDIRDLIRLTLELEGMAVVQATDGKDGIAKAVASSPDAIVLDVMMPGMDGWEVLSRLKAMGEPVAEVLGGGPEPLQRRRAQQQALAALVRVEGGRPGPAAPSPHPRLTRLDGAPISRGRSSPPVVRPVQLESLSPKQRELIAAVAASPTVIEAADRLSVSRSNVYASLRRIARKLGVPSVSDLVTLARSGSLT